MKHTRQFRFLMNRRGVTLLECVVTLTALSIFFLGAYQVYSSTYRYFYVREAQLNLVQDSQRIMSYIADDIRQAEILLPDYAGTNSYAVLLALKMQPSSSMSSDANTIIAYAIDKGKPHHLFRIVYANGQTTSLELSPYLDTLNVLPETEKLIKVELSLQETVAGKESTYHVASAYAMRL